MISISNMPQLKNVSRGNDMVADHYEKTVIMPTYLLAFIVCDFAYIEDFAGKQNQTSVSSLWSHFSCLQTAGGVIFSKCIREN